MGRTRRGTWTGSFKEKVITSLLSLLVGSKGDEDGEYLKTNEEQLIANYDIDFNFDGFAHSELIDRNLNM